MGIVLLGMLLLAGLASLGVVAFQAIGHEPMSRVAALLVAAASAATIFLTGFVVTFTSSERLGTYLQVTSLVVAAGFAVGLVCVLARVRRSAEALAIFSVVGLLACGAVVGWSATTTGRNTSHVEDFASTGRNVAVPDAALRRRSFEAHLAQRAWSEAPGAARCADVGRRATEWWDVPWKQLDDEACVWHAETSFTAADVELDLGTLVVSQWSPTAELFVF